MSAVADEFPPSITEALKRHGLSRQGLSVYVHVLGEREPRLAVAADVPRNPASVLKLVTTLAALEELGPAYQWKTELYGTAPVHDGRLDGDLYIKGYGDPYLVMEHFWRMLREARLAGLQTIAGDLVLDQSYFAEAEGEPGDFDGQATRPYNVLPRALLVNFQAVHFRLLPQSSQQLRVIADPPVPFENRIKLLAGPCGSNGRDWSIRQNDKSPTQLLLVGSYRADCGEDQLFRVLSEPGPYIYGLFQTLWREQGGQLLGKWREAPIPPQATLLQTFHSPTLAEVVRSINKYSNNVMARQLLLTLGAERYGAPATVDKGVQAVRDWLQQRGLVFPELILENGAGLSRAERISARSLGRLLQAAFDGPYMPEFVSALPVSAVDGTLAHRFNGPLAGRMHLKTGSLNDVRSVAGYVLDSAGRRVIVVILHNDRRAEGIAGLAVQQAVLEWVFGSTPLPETTTGQSVTNTKY